MYSSSILIESPIYWTSVRGLDLIVMIIREMDGHSLPISLVHVDTNARLVRSSSETLAVPILHHTRVTSQVLGPISLSCCSS